MDIDVNINENDLTSSSSNNNSQNKTAIGSERKNKLLNSKNQNENEIQDQQLKLLLKRSKLSTDDLIIENHVEHQDIQIDDEIQNNNCAFNLWSNSSSTLQQQEQNYYYYYYYQQPQQQNQQQYYNTTQKSCSYEYDHLSSNMNDANSNQSSNFFDDYFDANMMFDTCLSSSQYNDTIGTSTSTTSSSTNNTNIEQVINILIECE